MDLSTYLQDVARREKLAQALGTSSAYLYQIGTGHRKASPKLARQIHEKTLGLIPLESIRPDVWGEQHDKNTNH
jgi:DNA-binding transcriptional regulator YdaS (Cro superfamily)